MEPLKRSVDALVCISKGGSYHPQVAEVMLYNIPCIIHKEYQLRRLGLRFTVEPVVSIGRYNDRSDVTTYTF